MSRAYNTTTPLGRALRTGGWTATDFAAVTGINYRTLTEYLAGRRKMTPEHLTAAADALGLAEEDVDGGVEGVVDVEVNWWEM